VAARPIQLALGRSLQAGIGLVRTAGSVYDTGLHRLASPEDVFGNPVDPSGVERQESIVLCTIEAVWLGTNGGNDGIAQPGLPCWMACYAEFIDNGGRVRLCGACIKPRGITEEHLVEGVHHRGRCEGSRESWCRDKEGGVRPADRGDRRRHPVIHFGGLYPFVSIRLSMLAVLAPQYPGVGRVSPSPRWPGRSWRGRLARQAKGSPSSPLGRRLFPARRCGGRGGGRGHSVSLC
jgi:hypothetical protein